jgi:predicted Zn-dependent protease with MMP-like domain
VPEDASPLIPLELPPSPEPNSPRRPRRRDRHDRGLRGPAFGDTPFAVRGVPARRNSAERFDDIAMRVMRAVVERWTSQLGDVELAVEEVPVLGGNWNSESVPLASYLDRKGETPPRLVLFRRPLEHRAESTFELEALLLTVVVEQFAEVLGIPAEDVHPGYDIE